MIERLEESFQQINRFSADASHELRTPLTVLQGELEAVAQKGQSLPQRCETRSEALWKRFSDCQRSSKVSWQSPAWKLAKPEANLNPLISRNSPAARLTR